jgi:hypothetical protein
MPGNAKQSQAVHEDAKQSKAMPINANTGKAKQRQTISSNEIQCT